MHCSRQQWLVAGWLGPSITVRVRARARECGSSLLLFFLLWFLPSFLFFSVLKYHDVKMMYLASRNITTWESQCNDSVS